jgi:hypothetical protein
MPRLGEPTADDDPFFYMDEADPSKVSRWVVSVRPMGFSGARRPGFGCVRILDLPLSLRPATASKPCQPGSRPSPTTTAATKALQTF